MCLLIGPRPLHDDDLDDDLLGRIYREHSWRLRDADAGVQTLSWGFWRFADGVPDHLRGERPRLYDVNDQDAEDSFRLTDELLQLGRAAWLATQNPAAEPPR